MCVVLLLIFILAPVASLAAQAQDYAAWSKKNPDGSWTRITEIAVATSSLPSLEPKDIGKFCPAYKNLPRKKKGSGSGWVCFRPWRNSKVPLILKRLPEGPPKTYSEGGV